MGYARTFTIVDPRTGPRFVIVARLDEREPERVIYPTRPDYRTATPDVVGLDVVDASALGYGPDRIVQGQPIYYRGMPTLTEPERAAWMRAHFPHAEEYRDECAGLALDSAQL